MLQTNKSFPQSPCLLVSNEEERSSEEVTALKVVLVLDLVPELTSKLKFLFNSYQISVDVS